MSILVLFSLNKYISDKDEGDISKARKVVCIVELFMVHVLFWFMLLCVSKIPQRENVLFHLHIVCSK